MAGPGDPGSHHEEEPMSELEYFDEKRTLRREEAADVLRRLADGLASSNGVEVQREGKRIFVRVGDEVELAMEFEQDDDGSELEIELRWR